MRIQKHFLRLRLMGAIQKQIGFRIDPFDLGLFLLAVNPKQFVRRDVKDMAEDRDR